ncbi:MAG: outer membrane beta-barrel protein [Chitinophagaceae bacterium]|jgi:hypothetical protein
MFRFTLLVLFSFCIFKTDAQVFVKGFVKDELDRPVIKYDLSLLNAVDSHILLTRKISDSSGYFSIPVLEKQRFLIIIKQKGFNDFYTSNFTTDSNQELRLADITLTSIPQELNTVSVTAKYQSVTLKNGIMTLRVTDNPLATGITVLELLKQIPGIIVDGQNNVSVNGKPGVAIMFDGRMQQIPLPQIINLLSNMPSDAVSSVELIKNPQSNYDAAGSGGLINIITAKTKKKGLSGSVSESIGQGKRFGTGTNTAINYQSGKLRMFSNLSFLYRNPIVISRLKRTISSAPNEVSEVEENAITETGIYATNIKAGLETDLNAKTTAGINLNFSPADSWDNQQAKTSVSQGLALPFDHFNFITINREKYNSPSVNVYGLHYLDSMGSQLSFSADFTNFRYDALRQNKNRFFNKDEIEVLPMAAYNNTTKLDFKILTEKLDWKKVIDKTTQLEAGVKFSQVNNNSEAILDRNKPGTELFYKDTTFSNHFSYFENIYAAYANVSKSLAKMDIKLGLRSEHTSVDAKNTTTGFILKRSYINFFPSLSIDYHKSPKNNFQFTYSYRLDRPSYDQLNPSRTFSNQLEYSTGNPELRPQYSHNTGVDYTFNDRLTFSFSYTHIIGIIYGFPFAETNSQVQIDTIINLSNRNIVSQSVFYQLQFSKWFRSQLSVTGAYSQFGGIITGTSIGSSVLAFYSSLNNEIYLPGNYRLQVNGSFISGYKDAIQSYKPRGSADIAIQRKYLKDKLSVSVGLYDLLYTNVNRIETELPGQHYKLYMQNDSRRLRINFSWKFGSRNLTRKVENNQEDENKRLKKVN